MRRRRLLSVALLFLTVFPVFPAEAAGAVLCLCAQGHISLETACAGVQCCGLHDTSESAHDACANNCAIAKLPISDPGCTDIPLPVRNASMTAVNSQRTPMTEPAVVVLPPCLLAAADLQAQPASLADAPSHALCTATRLSARSTVLRC